ncbi:hypothetical protein B566_EDAN004321 [Ephemera danica]|nr:hypothetical protein B566_EDAN004321 [Ephemera danica]
MIMGDHGPRNPLERFATAVYSMVDAPTTWIRDRVVVPNRPNYNWYHRKYPRVPTIDECYTDDVVCRFEANMQFKRDNEILNILRLRFEDCVLYENPDHNKKCKPLLEQYQKATENWFIKYGDLGAYGDVRDAYMKQKHRMIWERRHGPVGTGMKQSTAA